MFNTSIFNYAVSSCLNHLETGALNKEAYEKSALLKEKAAELFQSSRVFHKYGVNKDLKFFEEIYATANSKVFELHETTKADLRRFKWELRDRENWLSKGWSQWSSPWKILNANLKRLPGGGQLRETIMRIQEYQRETSRISNNRISNIMTEMRSIGKDLDVDMTKLEKLELTRATAVTVAEKQNALNKISKFLGTINSEGARNEAGNIYLSVRDIMEGTPVEQLRRQIPPKKRKSAEIEFIQWDTKHLESFRRIQDNWWLMRKDLSKTAINAINSEKRLIANIDISQGGARRLTQYLEKLEGFIKEVEFTPTDKKTGRQYDLEAREVHEFGLNEKQSWKLNTELEYMPHYVLDLVKDLQQFSRYAHDTNDTRSAFEVFKDQIYLWEGELGVIDRLKSRAPINQEYYSRNPMLFLSKYAHEVSSYNHSNLLKESFQATFNKLVKMQRTSDALKATEETSMFYDQAHSLLNTLREDLMGSSLRSDTYWDKLSRGMTAYTFHRTMGWSWRTAAKNWGQIFIEKAKLGYGSKYQAEKILSEREINTAMEIEASRHGLVWDQGMNFYQELNDAWKFATKGLGQTQRDQTAGTRGALDIERNLMPGLKEVVDREGNISIVMENARATDKIVENMERLAGASAFIHSAVESYNRYRTFRVGFARAYDNLKYKTPEWFINKQMGIPKATKRQRDQWMQQMAGKLAANVTSDVHFEYSKAEKAQIFKGPAGKVIGQFQHYRMSLFDLQWNLVKRGLRDVLAERSIYQGVKKGEYARQAIRYNMTYQLIDAASFLTGIGFSNLFNNENKEWIMNKVAMITAERDQDGNLTEEGIKQIQKASYGKGALADMGASVGAILDLGEVMGLYSLDKERLLPYITAIDSQEMQNMDQQDRLYKGLGLLNIQAGRFSFKTAPSMRDGNFVKAFFTEMGLFLPYETTKRRREFFDWVKDVTGGDRTEYNRGGPRGPSGPRSPRMGSTTTPGTGYY